MTRRGSRDTGTDDPRVRVRPGRGSRPRTKQRPAHEDAHLGTVTRIDRGHYRVRLEETGLTQDGSGDITAVKARELGRGKVVVGDRVSVVGDVSGRKDTLARLVRTLPRCTLLRRSAEDGDAAGTERPVVANADLLVIVTAVADPQPRPRMIDRYLVAAYDAGMEPLLVLTKSDLADAAPLLRLYEPLGVRSLATRLGAQGTGAPGGRPGGPTGPGGRAGSGDDGGPGTTGPGAEDPAAPGPGPEGTTGAAGSGPADPTGIEAVRSALTGRVSVLVGHSGVGKSTLINNLVPGADRATRGVNEVTGRGRHTSASLQALQLPGGGWVIDTPGVRSFGVAHVSSADVLRGFPDLVEVARDCPRGCTHEADQLECALDEWAAGAVGPAQEAGALVVRRARVHSFRRLLAPALEAEDPTRP